MARTLFTFCRMSNLFYGIPAISSNGMFSFGYKNVKELCDLCISCTAMVVVIVVTVVVVVVLLLLLLPLSLLCSLCTFYWRYRELFEYKHNTALVVFVCCYVSNLEVVHPHLNEPPWMDCDSSWYEEAHRAFIE